MATNGVAIKRLDNCVEVTGDAFAHGGYADVFPGVISDSQSVVAIKVFRGAHLHIPTSELACKYAERLHREYSVWAPLQNTNVLPLLGLVDHPKLTSTGIVTRRCSSGDLREFLVQTRPEAVIKLAIVKGIASGLAYVHANDVVHGDLTMVNVLIDLVDGTFTPLLADFGRSRVLEQAGYTTAISSAVHRHLPPEILLADGEDRTTKALTQEADVWCFGMVMLETLSGKQPFWHLNDYQAAKVVEIEHEIPDRNRYDPLPHDDACWQIMGDCWHWDPSNRKKMHDLLQYVEKIVNV